MENSTTATTGNRSAAFTSWNHTTPNFIDTDKNAAFQPFQPSDFGGVSYNFESDVRNDIYQPGMRSRPSSPGAPEGMLSDQSLVPPMKPLVQNSLVGSLNDPGLLWGESSLREDEIYISPYDTFPQFLWPLDDEFQFPPPLQGNPSERHAQALHNNNNNHHHHHNNNDGTNDVVASGNIPYSNYPFQHQFRPGYPLKIHYIRNYLQDRTSWEQVCESQIEGIDEQNSICSRITSSVRDSISARMHGILSKTLELDHLERIPQTFPPLETLQKFFQAFEQRFVTLYPLITALDFSDASIDDQECHRDPGLLWASVMVLGGLVTPVASAQSFSIEMAYLLRWTINDRTQRDETYLADISVIKAFMLMTILSAWSGASRHSEQAEAHRDFSAFFARRGYYSARPVPLHSLGQGENNSSLWKEWSRRERENRLCQIWFVIEMEISFFYSTPSTMNFNTLHCPMPTTDTLVLADNQHQWKELVDRWSQEDVPLTRLQPPSLSAFYYLFLRNDFLHLDLCITAFQLRLLLCTLQTQVAQFAQSNRFIPEDDRFPGGFNQMLSLSSSILRQEELGGLLAKWHIAQERVFDAHADSQLSLSCRLMYHLVWLELLICYDDVQMVVGREGYLAGKSYLPALQRWSHSPSALKSLAHVGQIFNILSSTRTRALLPIWWPVALSRIALVAWSYTTGVSLEWGHVAGIDESLLHKAPLIALNDLEQGPSMHGRVLQTGEGLPCLRDSCNTLIPVYKTEKVLDACIVLLELEERSLPLCEKVKRFLGDVKRAGMPYSSSSGDD